MDLLRPVNAPVEDGATTPKPVGGRIKRAVDLIGALWGIILLLPLFLLLSCWLKFVEGGPIFYRHRRIGRAGKEFNCLKFRTMYVNGDEILKTFLGTNREANREWKSMRKLKDDPRVTAVGAVLRKYSIDEIPQLFNVLKGEMSLVGPRPIVREEMALYGAGIHEYFKARPGLTGLWQVSGRSDVGYQRRVAFDCQYVAGWSLLNDIRIMFKTLHVVAAGRGGY